MGRYLSADFGFGFALPTGEDDEFTPPAEHLDWFLQFDDEDERWTDEYDGTVYYHFDWYEVHEALEKEFPVSFGVAYVEDYSSGSVVFVRSTKQDVDHIGEVSVDHLPNFEEMDALAAIAKRFDVPFEPKWMISVSYG